MAKYHFSSSLCPQNTFFRSSPFLSPPVTTTPHFSSSQTPLPPPQPPTPPSQPPSPLPSSQPLRTTSSTEPPPPPPSPPVSSTAQQQQQQQQQKPTKGASSGSAESTDWIASTLTRRFGLGAGLAWAGFLAFGVVSEQIKTRLEVSQQEANTRDVEKQEEVVLPNGIRYYEVRVGGGASPMAGDLVVIDLKGIVEGSGQVFVDTFGGGGGENNRPLALVMVSRPYTKGMCEGLEYVLRSMKAGGRRRVIVPSGLGFGEKGAVLGSDFQVPPNATLEYVVQLDRVSIAPA